MKALHITPEMYEEMATIALNCSNSMWECVEDANGNAVTFRTEKGKPVEVEG